MNKRWLYLLTIAIFTTTTNITAYAAPSELYVSPNGNDSNACSYSAPCRTIQRGVNKVQPGAVLHIMAGIYSENVSVSKTGTQTLPIRIVGENAILSNGGQVAFSISNSQWLVFEGFIIKGYTLNVFEIRQSSFLTFQNNTLEYTFSAIRIKNGVSHISVENNEIYQTYPVDSTWSTLKGSKYEGGGIYASSGGEGMYTIRGNNFHDSMNGIYISDSDHGAWMNSNIFISENTFRNIIDDPFEPEGDSFNLHFFNNTLINTHRMASIVPNADCVGPIFIYGNYQENTVDPTGEAGSGRINSAVKLDMSNGSCPNGVWVFNNTINANISKTNFYGVDVIKPSIKKYFMLNNVIVSEKKMYSIAPSFVESISDFNISLKPLGYAEIHGFQADPLLKSNGELKAGSPAKGRGASIRIQNYFESSQVVSAGSDLGAFQDFPAPKYVSPVNEDWSTGFLVTELSPWIFADVPSSYWAANYIESLFNASVTGGCSADSTTYCPEQLVTRAQMAVFILKSIHGASYIPPAVNDTGFEDTPTSYWAAAWIKQLASEGRTSGCGNGNYCPDNPVTRAEMAVFLLKAKYGSSYTPPAVGADTSFGDVSSAYWASPWIKQLALESITDGCENDNYCPDRPVTRAQMAVFLVKTFNLP